MRLPKTQLTNTVTNWITGLVVTAMTALVRKMVMQAMHKAAGNMTGAQGFRPKNPQPFTTQTPRPNPTSQPQPFKKWAVQDALYQGMKKSELLVAYGQPDDKARPTFDQEIWTYRRGSNDNAARMTVTLDKGIVTDWAENA